MLVEPTLLYSISLMIPTTAAMTVVHEAGKHRRDWVWQPAVLSPIAVLILLKDILIILACLHILEWCDHSAYLVHLTFWILSASILVFHVLADKLVGPLADPIVNARLAVLKNSVANAISRDPDGEGLVTTSLDLADLPLTEKLEIAEAIKTRSLHDKAIYVIQRVGLPIPLHLIKSRRETI